MEPEKLVAGALQVEAEVLARQPAGDRVGGSICPAEQAETLEGGVEVVLGRVEQKILGNSQDIAIDPELLFLVLLLGRLRGNFDDEIGAFPLLPDQVVVSRGLLGYAEGHQDVRGDVLPAVALLVVKPPRAAGSKTSPATDIST